MAASALRGAVSEVPSAEFLSAALGGGGNLRSFAGSPQISVCECPFSRDKSPFSCEEAAGVQGPHLPASDRRGEVTYLMLCRVTTPARP